MGPCDMEPLIACSGDRPNKIWTKLTSYLQLFDTHPSCRQELCLVLQWHAEVSSIHIIHGEEGGRQEAVTSTNNCAYGSWRGKTYETTFQFMSCVPSCVYSIS